MESEAAESVLDRSQRRAIVNFAYWLYEECPVGSDEVTREKLIDLYILHCIQGVTPTREEILPHTRISVAEQKAKLFQILK